VSLLEDGGLLPYLDSGGILIDVGDEGDFGSGDVESVS